MSTTPLTLPTTPGTTLPLHPWDHAIGDDAKLLMPPTFREIMGSLIARDGLVATIFNKQTWWRQTSGDMCLFPHLRATTLPDDPEELDALLNSPLIRAIDFFVGLPFRMVDKITGR